MMQALQAVYKPAARLRQALQKLAISCIVKTNFDF